MQQSYSFPVLIYDEIVPDVVFYATVIPLAGMYLFKRFVVNPILERQQRRQLLKDRKARQVTVLERKREATAAVRLMRETVQRIISAEEAVGGLIIVQATYGQLFTEASMDEADPLVTDVTIPLQCMVRESNLTLEATPKASLSGFYDPCPGEKKMLRVRYQFMGALHEVTVDDLEGLNIPMKKHKISNAD